MSQSTCGKCGGELDTGMRCAKCFFIERWEYYPFLEPLTVPTPPAPESMSEERKRMLDLLDKDIFMLEDGGLPPKFEGRVKTLKSIRRIIAAEPDYKAMWEELKREVGNTWPKRLGSEFLADIERRHQGGK